jgi:hypothetical protein
LCVSILAEHVPKEQIFVLAEKPFHSAVLKTYTIGIKEKRFWTLAIDADVLLFDETIGEILHILNRLNPYSLNKMFLIQCKVLCFYHLESRFGGVHIYTTKNLRALYDFTQEKSSQPMPQKCVFTHTWQKCRIGSKSSSNNVVVIWTCYCY